MAGVEFVEEPTHARGSEAAGGEQVDVLPDRSARSGARLRSIATPLLFLGAAALAALAAFQNVYVLGFGNGKGSYRLSVDAWGSYTGGNGARAHEHEARYAWPLLACAVLFVLLAVHAVVRERSGSAQRFTGTASVVAVAVCGVAGGLAVAVYQYADAYLASQRAITGAGVTSGDPIRADIVTQIGACPALALAAALCGAFAIAISADSVGSARRSKHSPAP